MANEHEPAMRDQAESQEQHAVLIREIELTDAAAAADLSAELGYPATVEEMRERIDQLGISKDGVVYVACVHGVVAGWIDVGIVRHLASGRYAEIGGMIVSRAYRSGGIGRKLVAQAEQWVANRGISRMIVRSRVTREAAHRFYLREGYTISKTSAVFSKELEGEPKA